MVPGFEREGVFMGFGCGDFVRFDAEFQGNEEFLRILGLRPQPPYIVIYAVNEPARHGRHSLAPQAVRLEGMSDDELVMSELLSPVIVPDNVRF